jgi:hypothetical protein
LTGVENLKGTHVGRHTHLCVWTTVKRGQGRRVYVGLYVYHA